MKKKKRAFILNIFLFIAASLGLIYLVFYQAIEMNITSWTFLIVAISSLIRISQDIKEGFN